VRTYTVAYLTTLIVFVSIDFVRLSAMADRLYRLTLEDMGKGSNYACEGTPTISKTRNVQPTCGNPSRQHILCPRRPGYRLPLCLQWLVSLTKFPCALLPAPISGRSPPKGLSMSNAFIPAGIREPHFPGVAASIPRGCTQPRRHAAAAAFGAVIVWHVGAYYAGGGTQAIFRFSHVGGVP